MSRLLEADAVDVRPAVVGPRPAVEAPPDERRWLQTSHDVSETELCHSH
jgi:hypothetical protein